MDRMEESEEMNKLTTSISKDVIRDPHESIFQNGFLGSGITENGKINGNHSDLTDGDMALQREILEPSVPCLHNNLSNHVEKNSEVPKHQLTVEDMDNSTAANLSDTSLYEDSEKSMDVGSVRQEKDDIESSCETDQESNVLSKENDICSVVDHKGLIEKDEGKEDTDCGDTLDSSTKNIDTDCGDTLDSSTKNIDTDCGDTLDSSTKNIDTDCGDTLDSSTKNIVHEKDVDSEYKLKEGNTEINKSMKSDGKRNDIVNETVESEKNFDNREDGALKENHSSENFSVCSEDNSLQNDHENVKASANIENNCKEISKENSDSDVNEKKIINDKSDGNNDVNVNIENEIKEKSKTENFEVEDGKQTSLKSVEKVTDIDGSEILITINEEIEESDNEDNSTKKEIEEEKQKSKAELSEDISSGKKVIATNENSIQKPLDIAPKINPPTSVVNLKIGSTISGQTPVTTGPIRFPLMPGSLVQYGLTPQGQSATQQKYINVGGQQILITVPSSSIGPALNTGTSFLSASPLVNVNMVTATFPPPNPNKKPLDKTIDIDVPQASWEQKELIKYEVMSRKPDNAFWGGLANLNKKAELSSIAKFLFDLGSDIVKESAYEQIVQVQKKKEDAAQLNDTEKESLKRMKKVVEELKNKLKYLHDLPEKTCECGFTTDSTNVMFLHKQYPHCSASLDKTSSLDCAHCGKNFEGKFAEEDFKAHLAKDHNAIGKSAVKPLYWPCNLCPFEGTNKNTLMKHQVKCQKSFKQHLNLAPHHVDINLSLKNIFYKYQVNNKKLQQAQLAAVERPDTRSNSLQSAQKSVNHSKPAIQPKPKPRPSVLVNPHRPIIPSQLQPAQITGISASNSWQNNYSRILQTAANVSVEGSQYAQIQRPPPPLRPPTINKPTVNQLLKTQQGSSVTNRTGFEVCEICGGYVKDRMSLRIHFFYAHKIEMPAHVFSKPLAPLFCSSCNERFWTSQGFAKHKTSVKHLHSMKKVESISNQCWICHQKPENLYSHLHKFHRLTTGECMALKRCMFCGIQSHTRKELELHMAATHGVLIKGDDKSSVNIPSQPSGQTKPVLPTNVSTKNLSTVVTGGTSGMVRNNFCVFCSAQFQDNTKLTLHCLSIHATCKKCGMVVNKAADLSRHVCKLSSKTCSICGLKNLKPAGLIKHLETHVKPCKVVLKRLNTSQIHLSTRGKNRRDSKELSGRDTRLRSRSGQTDSEISIDDSKTCTNEKKSLTVALKFDKGKGKSKESKFSVVLDNKKGNPKDEVLIESDHDSDVIIEEEEKTEIILDSDIEEDKLENGNEKEIEVKGSKKSESNDKMIKVDKNECKDESAEMENTENGNHQSNDMETLDELPKVDEIKNENETKVDEIKKENETKVDEIKKESETKVDEIKKESETEFIDPSASKHLSKIEGEEIDQNESPTSNVLLESECSTELNSSIDTSKISRKRCHFDCENNSAEGTKKMKTVDSDSN